MMRTKAVDIARALGISKAAVSLALNGKPGVSEKTRQEVLECKRRLEAGETVTLSSVDGENAAPHQIKVVRVINGMKNVRETELDLWTDVNRVFEENLKANGYTMGLIYIDLRTQSPTGVIKECNREDVAGVVIFGTELKEENVPILEEIHKPLVIYDMVPKTQRYPVVAIDNRQGAELAVNELLEKGNREIIYLSNPMPMYNFLSRQRGFLETMKNRGYGDATDRIIPTGSCIEDCRQAMLQYIQSHRLPDGFIAESYHVTMGTVMAAQELGIRIPEDVSLVGIDMLPRYLTGGMAVSSVRVPHTERAYWAIQLLLKEIAHPVTEKCRMYTNCVFVEGESVRRKG